MCKTLVSTNEIKVGSLKALNNIENLVLVYGNYAVIHEKEIDSFVSHPLKIKGIDTLSDVDPSVKMFDIYDNFVCIRTKRYYRTDKETGKVIFIDVKNGNNLFLLIRKEYYLDGTVNSIIKIEDPNIISVGPVIIPIHTYISGVCRSFGKQQTLSDIRKLIISNGLGTKTETSVKSEVESKVRAIYVHRNGWCFDGFNLLISDTTSLTSLPETFPELEYFILFKNESSNTPVLLAHDKFCKYKVIYVHGLEKYTDVDIFKELHTNNTFAKTYSEYVKDLEGSQTIVKLPITGNNTMYIARTRLADLVKNHKEEVYKEGKAFVGEYSFTTTVFNKVANTLQAFNTESLNDYRKQVGSPIDLLTVEGEDNSIPEFEQDVYVQSEHGTRDIKAEFEKKAKINLQDVVLLTYVENDDKIQFVAPSHSEKKTVLSERVGETKDQKCGLKATIIDYVNSDNIKIRFEDGLERHSTYAQFRYGTITHTADRKGSLKDRQEKCKKSSRVYDAEALRILFGGQYDLWETKIHFMFEVNSTGKENTLCGSETIKLHVYVDRDFAFGSLENLAELSKYVKNGLMSRTIKDDYIQIFEYIIKRDSSKDPDSYIILYGFTFPEYNNFWKSIQSGEAPKSKLEQINLFDTVEEEEDINAQLRERLDDVEDRRSPDEVKVLHEEEKSGGEEETLSVSEPEEKVLGDGRIIHDNGVITAPNELEVKESNARRVQSVQEIFVAHNLKWFRLSTGTQRTADKKVTTYYYVTWTTVEHGDITQEISKQEYEDLIESL